MEKNKHVLVEKPFTTSVAEAEELVALAKQKNRLIMVGFTVLFIPAVQRLKQIVSSEDFGQIYYVYALRTNLGIVRDDVSVIGDLATHDFAALYYVLGQHPDWVSANGVRCINGKLEDAAFVSLHYPAGYLANLHVSWAGKNRYLISFVFVCFS